MTVHPGGACVRVQTGEPDGTARRRWWRPCCVHQNHAKAKSPSSFPLFLQSLGQEGVGTGDTKEPKQSHIRSNTQLKEVPSGVWPAR